MPHDPIRIRISLRGVESRSIGGSQKDFWASAGAHPESSQALASLETKLCDNLATVLQASLVEHFRRPLWVVRDGLTKAPQHPLYRLLRALSPDTENTELPKTLARMVREDDELREILAGMAREDDKVLRESPELRAATERLAAVAGVVFSVRIAGYSSLDLMLEPSPIALLLKAFDHNFGDLRVFLEAFLPPALRHDVRPSITHPVDVTVTIPPSIQKECRAQANVPPVPRAGVPAPQPNTASQSVARQRAELVWGLANGSLLLPVLLALLVLYFGIGILKNISMAQQTAMQPILEHHLKLLEEDRRRLLQSTTSTRETDASLPEN